MAKHFVAIAVQAALTIMLANGCASAGQNLPLSG